MSASTAASRRGSLRAAFRHPEFRLVAAALAISAAGNWLYNVALLVFVFDRTGSTGWVAAATILRLLPMMLFSPLGGAIADRFERRSVMIASDLARALLMGGLSAVAFASAEPALAVALAFLATTAGTPYG